MIAWSHNIGGVDGRVPVWMLVSGNVVGSVNFNVDHDPFLVKVRSPREEGPSGVEPSY